MIYEIRTYTLKPGTTVEFEARFAQRKPHMDKYSKVAAWWHTEIGPLNQVVHVWPYEDLNQRAKIRAAREEDRDLKRLPPAREFIVSQEAEVMLPAPFMKPLGGRDFGSGNVYEMRTYTFQPGTIPTVVERWEEAIPYREEFSPLVACCYSELGGLNKFVHIWVYKDLNERNRIRVEAQKGGKWPPQPSYREWLVRQEVKIMLPASFSPVQ